VGRDGAEVHLLTEFQPITVSAEKVLRLQGYRDLGQVDAEVRRAAEEAARAAGLLLSPGAAFRIVPLEVRDARGSVALEAGPRFRSADLARLLQGARHGAAFVATIGPGLEARVDALYAEGDFLAWFLLDSAGTLAVHLVVSRLRAQVAPMAREMGCRILGRIGPGHGDWPLTDQAALFALFEGAPVPVALLDAGLMSPKKSMSGLFGLVPL
jgi:hypothetical protein